MNKTWNFSDYLKWEFFCKDLPILIYSGNQQDNEKLINALIERDNDLIPYLLKKICMDKGESYPFQENDFKIGYDAEGRVNVIQINMPQYNPSINDTIRAYLVYTVSDGTAENLCYFIIRRQCNGKVYILLLDEKADMYEGEEITEQLGDTAYELWRIIVTYSKVRR